MYLQRMQKVHALRTISLVIEVGSPPPVDVEDDSHVTTSSPNVNGAKSPLWDKVCICLLCL